VAVVADFVGAKRSVEPFPVDTAHAVEQFWTAQRPFSRESPTLYYCFGKANATYMLPEGDFGTLKISFDGRNLQLQRIPF
jgi:hypothetical protein